MTSNNRVLRRAMLACLSLSVLAAEAHAATVTVTGTGDAVAVDGVVTLREAVTSINSGGDINADVVAAGAYGSGDTVAFNIAGSGTQTIVLTSPLPALTVTVTIDGFTQPGAAFGTPLIELNGSASLTFGLGLVNVSNCLIRGLIINRVGGGTGYVGLGISITGTSTNNRIQGNFIGTNAQGTAALPNYHGIQLQGAANNIIGTDGDGVNDAFEGNVISGNQYVGVYLIDASQTRIAGNIVGANAAGTAAVANGSTGIVMGGSSNTVIGTNGDGLSDALERNVISGNGGRGVGISASSYSVGVVSDGNIIAGNYIGTDITGAAPIANRTGGVLLGSGSSAAGASVSGSVVGSLLPGLGNVIAFNAGPGVIVVRSPTAAVSGNSIVGNQIFQNTFGIDLSPGTAADGVTLNDSGDADAGANALLNYPVVESAFVVGTDLVVTGWSRPATTLEIFTAAADATGFGQGQVFIGRLLEGSAADLDPTVSGYGPGAVNGRVQGADITNRFRFAIPIPPGVVVGTRLTATATDSAGNTSEFSGLVTVAAPMSDLGLVKGRPRTAARGANLVYVMAVTNSGPDDAFGVTVVDPTPSGLTFVSNGGDCTTAFPCSLGTIAVGDFRVITTTFAVPASYAGPDPILNTATVSSTSADSHTANNSSTATTPIGTLFTINVDVNKTGPASAVPGADLIYTITVSNTGTLDAADVVVADSTPAGLTFVSNAGACLAAFPCGLGTLPAGQSRTITSRYLLAAGFPAPGTIVNTATVTTSASDQDPSDNASAATTTVAAPQSDLHLTKSLSGAAVASGPAIFTLVVTNDGPSEAAAVILDDPTPAGLTFVSNSGACATAFPCALGTLAPGATRTVVSTFTVSSSPPSQILNTATVSSATTDLDPANNQASLLVTISPISSIGGCDLNGDGNPDLITGAGPGGGPHVRAFSIVDGGAELASFYAYDAAFAGGVSVACADIDGDGSADIITGAGPGGSPHVRAFSIVNGVAELASFYAYDPAFGGGVSVAAADVNGDGLAEIVTGPGPGVGPQVNVFTVQGSAASALIAFFAYDPAFIGGVNVASGDLDGDGLADIVTSAGPGGGPHVRGFSLATGLPTELASFYAYDPAFPGGVSLSVADLDNDGLADIVTGAGPGGGPHIRGFSLASGVPAELASFYAYDPAFAGGINVAATDMDGDGLIDIVTALGSGGQPLVTSFSLVNGTMLELSSFLAYAGPFGGGVHIGAGGR